MHALVATVHNPVAPHQRDFKLITRRRSIRSLAPKVQRPFICVLNGQPLLRAGWRRRLRDGDCVAFVTLPQGGGDGGSQQVAMLVATIAVLAFASYLGPVLATEVYGGEMLAFGTVTWAELWTGIASVAGMALVSALIQPPKPPTPMQASAGSAPSPTYSLQAQGNYARLESPIPVQYGRMMCFPDFAAQPYAEYAGNEQYLYQLLCLGEGEFDIEAIRIEDTPITSFDEITTEIVQPYGTLTLFPSAVETSGEVTGQDLTPSYSGPFVANAAGTTCNTIGVDLACPRGLFHYATSGGLETMTVSFRIEAQAIDNSGTAIGSWFTLGTESFSAATTTPQRFSKRYGVPLARYQVRAIRLDTKQTGTTYGHDLVWVGLRAYRPETRTFGNVTLIALRMRASANLSAQASRKINVIATRKLFTWNPSTGWSVSTTATRSIAWALADACKNSIYGGNLPDSRIDLAALYALDAVWSARGDYFDGRIDNAVGFWEALTKIAQVGRAKPYMQGGIVRFVRDAAQTVPVALFSMRNIVKGSFSIRYLMPSEETADAVVVSYFDSTVWAIRRVTASLPGSTESKPAKIDLTVGCTSRDQAYREGLYHAANNKYRRRVVKFSTEMEGFIPSFGDLIAIAHDMPAWGQTAEAVGWVSGTRKLTLTQPMTFGSGTHYIGLRKRDGSLEGPIVVTAGATAYELTLATSPSFTPYTGQSEERTHVVFGWGETWRQRARVLAIRPRNERQIEIEAITEDDNVHTAETGAITPTASSSQLPTTFTAPVVAGLTARNAPDDVNQMLLSWQPAAGAEYYIVEQSSDGTTWTRTAEVRASNFTTKVLYGSATLIRIAAVGLTRGPWVTISYGLVADYMWTADANLMWSVSSSTLMWS